MEEKVGSTFKDKTLSKETSSVFSWSPLPSKKKFDFTFKKEALEKNENKGNNNGPHYSNSELPIWMRTCEKEIADPIHGEIKGTVPKWLNGSLLRNGSGSIKAGQDELQHLFDGSALLHRFSIKDGDVTYQCKFLQSEMYKKITEANRLVITEFGTKAVPDPCRSIFQRIATFFSLKSDMSDNAMISLYPFGDEIYAFNEYPFIHRIDPKTLDTLERVDVSERINIVTHTSHPHVMEDSSVYNLCVRVCLTGPQYGIVHFPKKDPASKKSMFDKAKIVTSIPTRWPLHPSYMHSFGVTENYFIIVEQPLSVSLPGAAILKFQNEPIASALRWYGDEYTQIHVISKETGKVVKVFSADTFFYFHIINQYEESDHVIIDICAYRDPSLLNFMYFEAMKKMHNNPDYAKIFQGKPIRFILPLKSTPPNIAGDGNLVTLKGSQAQAQYLPNGNIVVKPEKLCDLACEMPRIHYEKYLGKKYQYFYGISADVDIPNPGNLIKIDVKSKTCRTWQEKNCYPGEPIFVPTPNSKFEDDGIVLSVLVWGQDDTNHVGLLILDAQSFKEIGRAEFRTFSPAPRCFHGWFLPDNINQAQKI